MFGIFVSPLVTRWSPYPGSLNWKWHPLVLAVVVFWDRWSPDQSGRLDRFTHFTVIRKKPGFDDNLLWVPVALLVRHCLDCPTDDDTQHKHKMATVRGGGAGLGCQYWNGVGLGCRRRDKSEQTEHQQQCPGNSPSTQPTSHGCNDQSFLCTTILRLLTNMPFFDMQHFYSAPHTTVLSVAEELGGGGGGGGQPHSLDHSYYRVLQSMHS